MKEQSGTTVSCRAVVIAVIVMMGTAFQVAFLKTAYNLPFSVIEHSIFCSADSCKEPADAVGVQSTVFWVLTLAAEPLGAVPAFLSGRHIAEKHGRTTLMLLAFLPVSSGLIIQGVAGEFPSATLILIPLGRLVQSFGTNWLLIGCITFLADLLRPKLEQNYVFSFYHLALSIFLPLVQVMGVPQVMGAEGTWPWLNALAGGVLVVMTLMLTMVPESPRYLYSTGDMQAMHRSLDFYNYSKVSIDQFMIQTMAGRSVTDWDRKQGYSSLKLLKRQRSHQLGIVYVVVLSSICQCLLMSNIVYFLTATILREGTEQTATYANFGTLSVFALGALGAAVGLRLGKHNKTRAFKLGCFCGALVCYSAFCALGFLGSYTQMGTKISFELLLIFLFCLILCFQMGLATLAEDIAIGRLIPVGQGPSLAIGISTGKLCEMLVSAGFLPVMRYFGLGFAWLLVVIPLAVCFCVLWMHLPKEKKVFPTSDPSIPLVVEPQLSLGPTDSPQVSPDAEPSRAMSVSVPASDVGKERRRGRFKHLKPIGKKRTKSASPMRELVSAVQPPADQDLRWKLSVSKSAYLQQRNAVSCENLRK